MKKENPRTTKKHNPKHLRHFWLHLFKHIGIAVPLIAGSLLMGVLGFHYFEGMTWADSLLHASMMISDMGLKAELQTIPGKLFASFYALYSGLFLLSIAGFLLVPLAHRVLDKFLSDP